MAHWIRNLLCIVLILVLASLFSGFFITPLLTADDAVKDGEFLLDGSGRVAVLSGEWEFYWDQLLDEGDLEYAEEPVPANIPGVWNNLKKDGEPLSGYGCGTYHITVGGLTPGEKYGLYIPLLSVSYDVYVDDELMARNGVVSDTEEGFEPYFLPQTAYFTALGGEADIIVHTSNYIYARNGMWHSIYLGTEAQISGISRTVIYKDLFFIGAFLTLAIYYASTYALRREKQGLLFVLLCVGAAMRILVNGDRVIARVLPGFPFEFIVRCDYWAILLFYPIMLFLMTRRFPQEFYKPVAFAIFGAGAAGSLLVLFLPVSVFTRYVVVAEVLMGANILYTAAMLGLALLRGRKNALPMFLSVVLLLCLTLHDTLYQMSRIDSAQGEIAAYGFFVFLLLESFAISKDYAESYRSEQELSKQLLESDKLKDRIRQTEMAFLQSQIKPHFLYNTLSVIDEYCVVDPPKASRLIDSLAQYLRQSFVFDNLEDCIPIEKELAHIRSYVEIEQARFDDLEVEFILEYQKSFSLPPLTIQPLVENAIRHGVRKKPGSGKVTVSIRQQPEQTAVVITDNGAGIPAEKLATLLTASTSSVGLINIHNRLLRMYGRGLQIESIAGEGTQVSFIIPEVRA